jgi:subtilisin family serine protease
LKIQKIKQDQYRYNSKNNMKKTCLLSFAVFLLLIVSQPLFSQDLKNWFNEDPSRERYAGVSSDLAYEKLLQNKKTVPVVVAVIDGGTDINHPDLKDNLWLNEGEIPGNGIDDDKNGYIDDVHGWNFIGGPDGDVSHDNMEAVREYNRLKSKYEGKIKSSIAAGDKQEYEDFIRAKSLIETENKVNKPYMSEFESLLKIMDEILLSVDDENNFTAEEVMAIESNDSLFIMMKEAIAAAMANEVPFEVIYKDIREGYKYYSNAVKYHYNVDFDPRYIVKDNYSDFSERFYGNNNVAGPDAEHGTHVAGIIAANRNNDIGIKGVASNAKIMVLRAVPNGDERDKDVANAIRYAADNGARIINMSFGKSFSPGKKHVDDAVRYAASKGVLLVHAAGNESTNTDESPNFPSPFYTESKLREPAWLEVGAITSSGDVADFSNYGKKRVDVFAPGAAIYSTMPGGAYEFQDGTSMAAPVVSGIAAMIWSYYPQLTAVQVKEAITKGVIKPKQKTMAGDKKVKFKNLCTSGGFVNAVLALMEASKM